MLDHHVRGLVVWTACHALQSGLLVEILPKFPIITQSTIWALYPGSRIVPAKVHVMIDFLFEHFNPIPPWERLPDHGGASVDNGPSSR